MGRWAAELLAAESLAAPHLMPIEAATILCRAELSGTAGTDSARWVHADLVAVRVELIDYEPLVPRVWALRGNVTCYDACYVALAEMLDAPLATLDRRLGRGSGTRCAVVLPPS